MCHVSFYVTCSDVPHNCTGRRPALCQMAGHSGHQGKCNSVFPLIVVFDLSAIQRDFKIIILQCHNHSTFFLLHILIFLRYSTFFLKHLHRFRNYSPFLLNYVFRFSVILLKFFLNHVLMFLNHSAFFLNHYT